MAFYYYCPTSLCIPLTSVTTCTHAGIIQSARSYELPDHVPYEALVGVIREFQSSWRTYTLDCLETAKGIVDRHMMKLVEEGFKQYPQLAEFIRHVGSLLLLLSLSLFFNGIFLVIIIYHYHHYYYYYYYYYWD